MERLHGKTVFIAGATGFIAKLLVKKILRLQPGIKRLYLLVRASDQATARRRVQSEIMQLPIFQLLREKYQTSYSSMFWGKVFPVAGDVSLKNLGINDTGLAEEIHIQTFFSKTQESCASLYDTALSTNTIGVKNAIEFASKCVKLDLFVLVSTAYVNMMEAGIVLEKPLQQWKSYDGRLDLDVLEQLAVAEANLKDLSYQNASDDIVRYTMKKIGAERAKKFGWTNAYVFTKAMGEMLAYEHKSNLPIVIVRPAAIISTWKEPLPGWIEGAKTIDTWITNYGKGLLKYFPADVTTIIDIVPADIVVNAMLCIVCYHRQGMTDFVYHIGSSMRNPITFGEIAHETYKYFQRNPFVGVKGLVKVKPPNFLTSMTSYNDIMEKQYRLPLKDMLRRGLHTRKDHERYDSLKREYDFTVAVGNIYWPFTECKMRFDDSNMRNLMTFMNKRDKELISCNIEFINWHEYFAQTHIPGIMEYESREAITAKI